MATLTGQAALDYIKSNPVQGYKVLNNGGFDISDKVYNPEEEDYGFLGNILNSIARPAVNLMGGAAEFANRIQSSPNFGEEYKPQYMSQENYDRYSKNPLSVLQDIASVGSMAVPGALGIKGALLAGGLQGFGSSKGEDLGSILTDTAMGGATGGALGLGGKILSNPGSIKQGLLGALDDAKVSKLGNKLEERGIRKALRTNYKSAMPLAEVDQLGDDLISRMRNDGLSLDPTNVEPLYNLNKQRVNEIASAATDKFANSDVFSNFVDKARSLGVDVDSPRVQKDLERVFSNFTKDTALRGSDTLQQVTDLNQLGSLTPASPFQGESTVLDLVQSKGQLQPLYERVKKLEQNGILPRNSRESLEKALYETIDPMVKNVNGMADPYQAMAIARKASGDVARQLEKGGSIAVPGTFGQANISIPLENMFDKGLRKVGETLNRSRSAAATRGQGLSSVLGNPKGVNINPTLLGMLGGRLATQGGSQESEMLEGFDSGSESQMSNPMSGGGMGQGDRIAFANQLLSQGMKPSDVKTIFDLYGIGGSGSGGGGGEKLTENQKKYMSASELASRALNLLEGGKVSTGKVASVTGSLGRFFGSQGESQTDYLSKLASARGVAVSALSGANVPPDEYKRIANMIPEDSDEPKVAKQKLRSFIEAMQVYAGR